MSLKKNKKKRKKRDISRGEGKVSYLKKARIRRGTAANLTPNGPKHVIAVYRLSTTQRKEEERVIERGARIWRFKRGEATRCRK